MTSKTKFGLLLLAVWAAFGIYEYKVRLWAATQTGAIFRFDLVFIIPILAVATVGLLFLAFMKKKS
jgi:hypothetical protein